MVVNTGSKSNEKEKANMKLPLHIDFTSKAMAAAGAGGVLCGAKAEAFAAFYRGAV